MKQRKHLPVYVTVLALLICSSLGLFSCAPQPPLKPSSGKVTETKESAEPAAPEEPEDATVFKPVPEEHARPDDRILVEDISPSSLLEVLSGQALKFVLQEEYKDALFIYNQALALIRSDVMVDDTLELNLIAAVESLLSQTPPTDIEQFMEIRNLTLPRSLLLYWLGVNLALEGRFSQSKDVLGTFLTRFPDHPYAVETRELLAAVNNAVFKRHTIGCLLPLSGKYAVFGQRALTGIQLAIHEMSEKYGRKFNMIIFDTQADPEIAAQGVIELYEKNVAAILGPLLNIDQAGAQAQKLKIPLIALTQKHEFPLKRDYLFANFITPQMQVQTLGAYLFGQLGLTKAACLYPDERYGKTYMDLFWDVADEYNVRIMGVEAYNGKDTDFTEPIQKLTGAFYPVPEFLQPEEIDPETGEVINVDTSKADKTSNARRDSREDEPEVKIDFQALFIPDSPATVNMILPQLAFNDAVDIFLVGTNLWHSKRLLEGAKGYNSNAVIADGFFSSSQHPAVQTFTEKFEALFDEKPRFLEAIAYDNASLLLTFAMDETVDSREALKDTMTGKRIYEGVTGNTIFDGNGVSHRPLFLMTIQKSKFIEISR